MSDCTAVSKKFNNLVEIMKRLRAPGGCPWDREQTYLTLRRYIIEEAYELIEAIEKEDLNNICEECGDLLLQVVFVSCIAAEHDNFDISNVIDYISEKLVRRHP
ncbi:MAG: MazG nucleotide pyrophosphohydrolase domain-containing protein, partial [Sphaerochaetaceae bacterium]|nr:MazG nucleotide pyrophosphohydrolase domain-containing protein [Sphaerochaetaceae bacterium]